MAANLHLTSPSMAGPDVLQIQKKLASLGFAPGPLDGIYGPATAGAVRSFQRAKKLKQDGIVTPEVRAALRAAPKPPPDQPIVRKPSSIGQLALEEAIKHIGATEVPKNSNKTSFGKWFGVDGCAWCNIFVSYCFKVGANYTIGSGGKGPGIYTNGCTYVPTTEAWLKSAGMWKGQTTPLPGDIAIYNWDGGVPDHIGIVEAYLGGGKFNAIEGNTSVGNDSNGGSVMRRLRYMTNVDGFGRVAK